MHDRPATIRAYAKGAPVPNSRPAVTEEGKKILFGQTAASVGASTGNEGRTYYGAADLRAARRTHAVGPAPPSMTYSAPVMEAARGETRNAIRSATSAGFAGRPIGMPPSDFMMICLPPS